MANIPAVQLTTTPEPHLIPGYMGLVPGMNVAFGHTYGQQTHYLFVNPNVVHSERIVLSDRYANDYQLFEPDTEDVLRAQKKFAQGYPEYKRPGQLMGGIYGRPVTNLSENKRKKTINKTPNIRIITPEGKSVPIDAAKPPCPCKVDTADMKCVEYDYHDTPGSNIIYRRCAGIVPAYGGHVPREMDRFGKTFGLASLNAKRNFKYQDKRTFI